MHVELKYTLPEEKDDFELAINGIKYYGVICDFKEHLRNELKYGNLSDKEYDIIDKIRDKFFQIIEENSISLNEF